MTNDQIASNGLTSTSKRKYDLAERTYQFAKNVLEHIRTYAIRSISNGEIVRQLTRTAGSVGANYLEADEALSRKDFALHIKICRKESRETAYWLRLLSIKAGGDDNRAALMDEARQLVKIFHAILEKTKTG